MQEVPIDHIHDTLSMQGIPEDEAQTIASVRNCTFRNNKTLRDIAGVGGNVLEWYDFAVFGYFSDVLGDVFFPKQEGNAAMIESFSVFGLAFLCRPIGGILLGYIGDVYGRKRALEISIFLMAFPTFLLGCLPSYAQVGSLSFILLIIVRMLQGFSVGGQLVTSLVYTCENNPRPHWGFYGSFVMAAANFGTLLGGIMATYLRSSLDDDQLHEFGWRIPFLSGILVCVCGIYLRYFCDDDEAFHVDPSDAPANPLAAAFARGNERALIAASLVPMLWAGGFYIIFVWMAVFMEKMVKPPVPEAFLVNSGALFLSVCILFPVAGSLSDRIGRKRMMYIGCLFLACLCPFMVIFIAEGSNSVLIGNSSTNAFIAQFIMGIFLSCFGAPMCAWLVESFPAPIRLTSVAFGYNIGNCVAGGTAPALATYLVDKYGNHSPGFMITVIALISLLGLVIAPGPAIVKEDTQDIPGIELPETQNNPVRHNDSLLGIEVEEFEDNRMRKMNTTSSLFTIENGHLNSNFGTVARDPSTTRMPKEDESYLSYDNEDISDGMSFGPSDIDDGSVRGEII